MSAVQVRCTPQGLLVIGGGFALIVAAPIALSRARPEPPRYRLSRGPVHRRRYGHLAVQAVAVRCVPISSAWPAGYNVRIAADA